MSDPEDEVGILPQNYMMSQCRRPQLKTNFFFCYIPIGNF